MDSLETLKSRLTPYAPAFLQLSLWASLWFSLQPGNIENIGSATSFWAEIQNLRAGVPLLSGLVGIVVIGSGLVNRKTCKGLFFGPLSLMVAYGLVGIVSTLRSPDFTIAIYWVGIYLAVPLVAWAIISRGDPLARASNLLRFNWIVVIAGVVVLLVVAFLFLNLHKIILEPSNLLECRLRSPFHGESWFALTSEKLRSTGVGRYAAIAGILALGGMWHGRGRYLWGLLFVGAMLLLLTSGARASYVGFAFAAPLVIFLHGGWKAFLAASGGLAIVWVIFWSFGLDKTILDKCLLSAYDPSSSALRISPTSSATLPALDPTPDPGSVGDPSSVDPGGDQSALRRSGSGEEEPDVIFGRIVIPEGIYSFSGRTVVWKASWDFLKQSPFLGYGFQGDRLILGTHIHNAMLHALFQTGWIGFIPFAGALIWGWILLVKSLTALSRLPLVHKRLLIQTAGVLTFLTFRSIWESSGAFFGVDWFFLAAVYLYIQLIDSELTKNPKFAEG